MINCVCSKDTDERTECVALDPKWYYMMIREKKCGNEGCPFWKPKEENKTARKGGFFMEK